ASYQALTNIKSIRPILQNLQLVAARRPVTVRYVLIPGYTDGKDSLAALIGIMKSLPPAAEVEVLPYHTMGIAKWEKLNWDYPLQGVPEATKAQTGIFRQGLRQAGIRLAATES
ncbi:MAG: pyruvate formate-lyase 1-activating enzyme, partial [Selenomonas sp.]|nr:pyruvate formate-lyase 1-activating enzyme [Selenomonas sp.]